MEEVWDGTEESKGGEVEEEAFDITGTVSKVGEAVGGTTEGSEEVAGAEGASEDLPSESTLSKIELKLLGRAGNPVGRAGNPVGRAGKPVGRLGRSLRLMTSSTRLLESCGLTKWKLVLYEKGTQEGVRGERRGE